MNYTVTNILESIADDLNLTETELGKIKTSYKTIGNILNENDDIKKYGGVTIFPQGSVGLGTVVRPLNDEYDVDMVLLLNNRTIDMKTLKQLVGDVLKSDKRYSDKLDEEGKRCWTLKYDGYHMDILPTRIDSNPIPYKNIDSIEATEYDKIRKIYLVNSWRKTNPKGYLKWFLEQCDKELREGIRKFSIEKIEEYPVKTTLQKAVQLIKRHRDLYFSTKTLQEQEDKPISIIITTLAAEKYNGESNALETIINIARRIKKEVDFIGITQIINPVNPKENFADRWMSNPNKKRMFEMWINQLEMDMVHLSKLDFASQGEFLKKIFGDAPVKRVYESLGNGTLKERKNQELKVDKKTGALNVASGVAVAAHTFYGEEKKN